MVDYYTDEQVEIIKKNAYQKGKTDVFDDFFMMLMSTDATSVDYITTAYFDLRKKHLGAVKDANKE